MTTSHHASPDSDGGVGSAADTAGASRARSSRRRRAPLTVDEVLITKQLSRRSARKPDHAAETRALHAVARAMNASPRAALEALLEQALALCCPDGNATAGVSLIELAPATGGRHFRWTAIAGRLARFVGGTTAIDHSPCGVCLAQGSAVLFARPDLCFPDFQSLDLPIVEGLVLPLYADGVAAGTIWIMSHDDARPFDAEDVRVMTSLADFAGAAYAAIHERDRATALLESITDAFYAVDDAFRLTYANARAEELWGRSRDAIIGRDFWAAFPAAVGTEPYLRHLEAMRTRQPVHFETMSPIVSRWLDVSLYPTAGGGLACYVREAGERKAAEAERERLLVAERVAHEESEAARRDAEAARRDAETANKAKADFLAVMSHELRTPLNAIGGYAELMDLGIRGPVTPEQHEDLVRIRTSQLHLLGLINELLNYAKLETGTVAFEVGAVTLRDSMTAAADLVSPQAARQRLTLEIADCPSDLAVRADGEKVRQILVNLLSNAVKFTPADGRIDMTGTLAGAMASVAVRDTGIGIPAGKLDAIFDPFVQVDSRLTRTTEGTGLGLAISRDLARAMGGDLTVESRIGAGSTFTLVLPAA